MASTNLLDTIDRINVVSWEWNERAPRYGLREGTRSIGVIAQELEQLFPELVVVDDTGYRSVDYGALAAIAIAGVQRLRRELEAVRGPDRKRTRQTTRIIRRRPARRRLAPGSTGANAGARPRSA